jgi:hypothetical protein
METLQTPLPPQAGRVSNKLALVAGWLGIGSAVVSLLGFMVNMVLPGIGLICCGLGILASMVGLVLGIIALVQLKNAPEQTGKRVGDHRGSPWRDRPHLIVPVADFSDFHPAAPGTDNRERLLPDQQQSGCSLIRAFQKGRQEFELPPFLLSIELRISCFSRSLRVCLPAGVVRSRRASRSSKPAAGRVAGRGGFDPHPLPPIYSDD